MRLNLSTKKGAHVKPDSYKPGSFPGGYKGYLYIRAAPKPYPKTKQQRYIAAVGAAVSKNCPKGKYKGAEFRACVVEQAKELAKEYGVTWHGSAYETGKK
ncbi:hypothetical protein DRN85_08605 [Methanosarcinales archaeon]|nr:MAG: hypothetical protein DRN85_08605 [Methanosarcinales archaeon]RLI31560.1 MAG: hypothetical protein DRO48_00440 [Candidatus Bathyarchaeota archaeon]